MSRSKYVHPATEAEEFLQSCIKCAREESEELVRVIIQKHHVLSPNAFIHVMHSVPTRGADVSSIEFLLAVGNYFKHHKTHSDTAYARSRFVAIVTEWPLLESYRWFYSLACQNRMRSSPDACRVDHAKSRSAANKIGSSPQQCLMLAMLEFEFGTSLIDYAMEDGYKHIACSARHYLQWYQSLQRSEEESAELQWTKLRILDLRMYWQQMNPDTLDACPVTADLVSIIEQGGLIETAMHS